MYHTLAHHNDRDHRICSVSWAQVRYLRPLTPRLSIQATVDNMVYGNYLVQWQVATIRNQ